MASQYLWKTNLFEHRRGGREVVDDDAVVAGLVIAEGEGLLPGQLGGEAVGVSAGVAPHASGLPAGA
ncbi:Methyltransferase [Musa troglodytarum]|uniref:Methyltransferase n=1 Tax=Musa troglodytarum TaxID=320322 RepID=A0A9E7H545_9LILI|nr:Methyltransferase [Musa troglodytarum]